MSKPDDWEAMTLSDVITSHWGGTTIKTKEYSESGTPVLTKGDVKPSGVVVHGGKYVDTAYAEEMGFKFTRPGDFIVTTRDLSTAANFLGLLSLVPKERRFLVNQGSSVLRIDEDKLDPRYFVHWCCGDVYRGYVKGHYSGATQIHIRQKDLMNAPVWIPPLPTQHKIASILSAYDDLIENNTRRIAILEEMAQSIYREWFVNFRFPGFEDVKLVDSPLEMIPEGWEVVPFTDIADILSGGTPKTTNSEYWNGDIPFFTPRDCPNGFFVLSTARSVTEKGVKTCSSANFPDRSIFITARGTVGKTVLTPCNMAMSQSCYAVKPKVLPPEFIFLMLRSSVEELKSKTHGAVFDTIIKDTFTQIHIALSPDEVALPFVESVKPIFDALLVLYKKNSNLRTTRDLLLPKLISGKLDVEDLDINVIEPLEELQETTA